MPIQMRTGRGSKHGAAYPKRSFCHGNRFQRPSVSCHAACLAQPSAQHAGPRSPLGAGHPHERLPRPSHLEDVDRRLVDGAHDGAAGVNDVADDAHHDRGRARVQACRQGKRRVRTTISITQHTSCITIAAARARPGLEGKRRVRTTISVLCMVPRHDRGRARVQAWCRGGQAGSRRDPGVSVAPAFHAQLCSGHRFCTDGLLTALRCSLFHADHPGSRSWEPFGDVTIGSPDRRIRALVGDVPGGSPNRRRRELGAAHPRSVRP